MTLEQFLAMAFAGPVAGVLAMRGVREAARLEKQPAYRVPGLLREVTAPGHGVAVAVAPLGNPSFYLLAGNPLFLKQRLRRRRHKRRLRRTFWLLSWVAGLLGLSFVGILGLWTALGQ